MKHIAFIVASPSTINSFMIEHISHLSKNYKITVIANSKLGELGQLHQQIESNLVNFIDLPIQRNISLVRDFMCLVKLLSILRCHKFDVVHTITPKAGLLGMLSSFFARTSYRFHTFTGQVWITRKGVLRHLLISIDKFIFRLSNHVLIDSPSQRDFLLSHFIVTRERSTVLGQGSISGVDISKFEFNELDKSRIRSELTIPQDAFVNLFLGRLCKDKGLDELLEAFLYNNRKGSKSYLLLVGPNEGKYTESYLTSFKSNKIILLAPTSNPNQYFSASDLLVLPSYREGFGTTVLEAAANGIPTLASNIYGLSDAVVDKETGFLHEVKNVQELSSKMLQLEQDTNLTKRLGQQANVRVKEHFSSIHLSNELVRFYKEKVGV